MVLLPFDRYQRLLANKQDLSCTSSTAPNAVQHQDIISENDSPIHMVQTEESSQKRLSQDIENLIPLFPKTLQARARALLTYILPYITWNEKGEVAISGEFIPNSNIVDLIRGQLKDYRAFRPSGVDKFEILFKDINVPLSLLTLSRREQIGQGKIPPPPGIAVKNQAVITKKPKVKWLKR